VKDLIGKVAFITGGASGLGFAMARVFGRAGMTIVIADLRQDRIAESLRLLRSDGINASGITLDVTDRAAYRAAADEVEASVGPVQLLCNNAGIGAMGRLADATYNDWDWILGVNLGGVVNGLCTFLPRMRSRTEECHILSTASAAGLIASENVGIYVGAKMAVVGIMEVLRAEVASESIGVSVVCPHLMRTNIHEHATLRPSEFINSDADERGGSPPISQEALEAMSAAGMDPLEVAEHALEAVRDNRLYVIPFPELRGIVKQRYDAIMASMPNTIPDARRVSMEAPTLSFAPYLEAVRQGAVPH
jgi:NAD(P)-dependent dehydrogenase (short-subunit alcohol dehydrogenase family)